MLSIAHLFAASTVADSLDYAIERDAQNGRINGQFLNLMATCYGAELPASPVAFVKAVNDYRSSPTMPRFAAGIGAVKGARHVHTALAAIVGVLAAAGAAKGLPTLADDPKWLAPKPPKPAKAKADTQDDAGEETDTETPTVSIKPEAPAADDMLANRDTILRQAIALVLGGHATAAQKAALQSALDRSTATAPAEAKQAKRKGATATQKAIDAKAELTARAVKTVKAIKGDKAPATATASAPEAVTAQ